MTSGPVAAMCWEGSGVIKEGRKILGATHPSDSAMGTIRGNMAIDIGRNICHGSDSAESARKEIAMWFPDGIISWDTHSDVWVNETPSVLAPSGNSNTAADGGKKELADAGKEDKPLPQVWQKIGREGLEKLVEKVGARNVTIMVWPFHTILFSAVTSASFDV